MKKFFSLLLTLSLLLALFAGMGGTASAEDYYGDHYSAFDNGDGTCTIAYSYDYAYATEIHVPNYVNGMRVTDLNFHCFEGFTQLETLILPEHLRYIREGMFSGCYNLKSIRIPASVTRIDDDAFYGSSLSEIKVASGSKTFCSVDGVLFTKDMRTLLFYPPEKTAQSYTIPNGVKKIAAWAFEGCGYLTAVTIADSVESIGDYAFAYCGNSSGIRFTLPAQVSYVGIEALASASAISVDSKNLYYASKNGILFSKDMTKLVQYPARSAARSYTIPDTVTEIGVAAFALAANLQTIAIPDCVVAIDTAAFSESGLVSVAIPQGVQELPAAAFNSCYELEQVILPDHLTAIGEYAFAYCESLTEVEIPFGITQISSGLFYECSSLTSLVIPASVGKIYADAFSICETLSDIEFTGLQEQWDAMHIRSHWEGPFEAASVKFTGTAYEDSTFRYAEDGRCGKLLIYGLTSKGKSSSLLEIPAELNEKPIELIAPYAFAKSNVREAVLQEGIQVLGANAFNLCDFLEKISLPSTLTVLGEYAFNYCADLESLTIPDGITELAPFVCFGCESLKSIDLPDGLSSIGEHSFSDCFELTSVKLPEKLESIGLGAFWGCIALQSITLPDSIRTVSDWAFNHCTELRWVYIPEGLNTLSDTSFSECDNLESIFYGGSYSQWQDINDTDSLSDYCDVTVYFNCNPVVGSFMDVKAGDWFVDSVAYAYENGLMNGVSDMLFAPSGSLTRGQLVAILYRVAGQPDVEASANFTDVDSGKYYAKAIAWAAENGIVDGYADGTFKPNNPITREQIATILYRYKGSPAITGTLDFPDVSQVNNYAKNALLWAMQEGLINGIKSGSATNLAPKNTATRAQIATIIMRYNEKA